jgi:hypothetical protein
MLASTLSLLLFGAGPLAHIGRATSLLLLLQWLLDAGALLLVLPLASPAVMLLTVVLKTPWGETYAADVAAAAWKAGLLCTALSRAASGLLLLLLLLLQVQVLLRGWCSIRRCWILIKPLCLYAQARNVQR